MTNSIPPDRLDATTNSEHIGLDGRRLSAMAWVTGTLGRVREVASSVSLAAMNARVIASRAGSTAMTFVPITQAVDALARDVDRVVSRIEKSAVHAAEGAARAYIYEQRARHFALARKRLGDQPALNAAAQRFEHLVNTFGDSFRASGEVLVRELDKVDALLRASLTLSTLSRIEAARVATHRKELASIGEAIDLAAGAIRSAVSECRARLAT